MSELLEKFFKFLQVENYQVDQIGNIVTVNIEDFMIDVEFNQNKDVYEFIVVDTITPFGEYPIKAIQQIVKKKFNYDNHGRFLYLEKISYLGMFELFEGLNTCKVDFKEIRQNFYGKKSKLDSINLRPRFLRLKDVSRVFDKNFILEVNFEYYSKFWENANEKEFLDFTVFGSLINENVIHVEIYRTKDEVHSFIQEFDINCQNIKSFLYECYERVKFSSLKLD